MALAAPHPRRSLRFLPACRRGESAMVAHAVLARRLMPEPETPSETPEALLCRIAQVQDRAAFQRLFLHFAPRIKSHLLRKGAASQKAEDLAKEALRLAGHKLPVGTKIVVKEEVGVYEGV